MKKLLSIILLIVVSFTIHAQTVITVGGYQCYVHYPQGYTSGQLVNVMVFLPGLGETQGAVTELKINGPFAPWGTVSPYIYPGIVDTTVIAPGLVVLAVEPNAADGLIVSQTAALVTAIQSTFNIYKMAVTGLSLGSQEWTTYAFTSRSNFAQANAYFLYSSDPTPVPEFGGPGSQAQWFSLDSAYYYGGCGTADAFYGTQLALYDSIANNFTEYRTPEFTAVAGSGHDSTAWQHFYSPYWIDPVTGRNIYSQFMFEFPLPGSSAHHWYVAPTGSDGNNGQTQSTAWLTPARASANTYSPGDSLLFEAGGTYYGNLTISQSGTSTAPITIASWGTGAKPIITGFSTITGWTNPTGNQWIANCPNCGLLASMVTNNAVVGHYGRTPNSGFYTYTPFSTTRIIDPINYTQVSVGSTIVVKTSEYTFNNETITLISGDTLTVSPAMPYSGVGGIGWFVVNTTPDTLGEYTYNPSTKNLTIYNIGSPTNIQAATVGYLFSTNQNYINLTNLDFEGADTNAINIGQQSIGYVNISNCNIHYGGQDGIGGYSTPHLTVYNNDIRFWHDNGLFLYNLGTPDTLAKYLYNGYNTYAEIGLEDGMGIDGASGTCEGVNAPFAHAIHEYNTFDSIGYHAIYWGGDSSIVRHNLANYALLRKADGAAYYTWDQNVNSYLYWRLVDSNMAYNCVGNQQGIVYDSVTAGVGIYVDNKAQMVNIFGNTITGSKSGVYDHGSNVLVRNNKLYNNLYANIDLAEIAGNPITGVVIASNTIVSSNPLNKAIVISTATNDLTTIAFIDSNSYIYQNGLTVVFRIKPYNVAFFNNTFPQWQSTIAGDVHSTFTNTNGFHFAFNGSHSTSTEYFPLTYNDISNVTYAGTVSVSALSSIIGFNPRLQFWDVSPGEYLIYFRDTLGRLQTGGNDAQALGATIVAQQGVTAPTITIPANKVMGSVLCGLHGGLSIDADSGNVRITGSTVWGSGSGTYSVATELTDSAGDLFYGATEAAGGWNVQNTQFYIVKKNDGTVWMVGDLTNGVRGNGTAGSVENGFVQVFLTGGKKALHVYASQSPAVVCTDGTVQTWGGGNDYTQNLGYAWTGTQYETPHDLGLAHIRYLAKGVGFNYAVDSSAVPNIYGWGIYGSYLGLENSFIYDPVGTPTLLNSALNFENPVVDTVVCNHLNTKVILADSTLWGWGGGDYGLGNGDQINWATYTTNPAPTGGTLNPYNADIGVGEHLIPHPVQIWPGVHDFYKVWGGLPYVFYNYEKRWLGGAHSGAFSGDGRNKGAVLGDGVLAADSSFQQIEGAFACSFNVPTTTTLHVPQTAVYLSTSPYCITHPTVAPCSNYTVGTHTPPSPQFSGSVVNGLIQLSAVGSTDARYISYYKTTETSGPSSLQMGNNTSAVTNVPTIPAAGTYVFQLQLINVTWDTSYSTFTLTVGGTPPTVSAGNNQTVRTPVSSVTLLGSASANGGATLVSTVWTQFSGANCTITSPTSLGTTVTGLTVGVYTFKLTVTDSNNQSSFALITVTVLPLTENNIIVTDHHHVYKG